MTTTPSTELVELVIADLGGVSTRSITNKIQAGVLMARLLLRHEVKP